MWGKTFSPKKRFQRPTDWKCKVVGAYPWTLRRYALLQYDKSIASSTYRHIVTTSIRPQLRSTFGVLDCDDFWQRREEQYFMYVTSRICQTFGKSTQSRTPNACIFSPLGAYPTPLFPKLWVRGVGKKIRMLSEQCKCKYIVVDWLSSSVWWSLIVQVCVSVWLY